MIRLQRRGQRTSALVTPALHPTCHVQVSPACRRAPKGALDLLQAEPAALGRQGHCIPETSPSDKALGPLAEQLGPISRSQRRYNQGRELSTEKHRFIIRWPNHLCKLCISYDQCAKRLRFN